MFWVNHAKRYERADLKHTYYFTRPQYFSRYIMIYQNVENTNERGTSELCRVFNARQFNQISMMKLLDHYDGSAFNSRSQIQQQSQFFFATG